MSLDTDLVSHLRSHPAVAAIVGDRIYPSKIPDTGTLPCVVYRRISTVPSLASGHVPLRRCRYQIDAWATRHTDADALAEALRQALDMGEFGASAGSFPDNDADDPDHDSGAYRRRLDYFIWER